MSEQNHANGPRRTSYHRSALPFESRAVDKAAAVEKALDSRPRILCLHGGGVSAAIFRAQARALIRHLPGFRLVFADGPHVSEPGPGILPVYEKWGPFRRWLRWRLHHPELDDQTAADAIVSSLERCKAADASTGPWVALLGFSQGAKMAVSLLYDQQIRAERDGRADTAYRFAVLLAGRGPLLSFCRHSLSPALMTPGQLSSTHHDELEHPLFESPHVLRLPTVHVHGLRDGGLPCAGWRGSTANRARRR